MPVGYAIEKGHEPDQSLFCNHWNSVAIETSLLFAFSSKIPT